MLALIPLFTLVAAALFTSPAAPVSVPALTEPGEEKLDSTIIAALLIALLYEKTGLLPL